MVFYIEDYRMTSALLIVFLGVITDW